MRRTFVETTLFTKQWFDLGLTEDDLDELQRQIMDNPQIGDVIPGTGRIRKMRFVIPGRGKRGGSRVCYVDFAAYETIYLMTVYGKGKKENLSENEKKDLKKVVSLIEQELEKTKRSSLNDKE